MNNLAIQTPESIVRVEIMGPHFSKFHLGDGRVLHRITKAEDQYFHDHPWPFRSSILSGGYVEAVANSTELMQGRLVADEYYRLPSQTHEVTANTVHKIVRLLGPESWSLIEPGKKEKEPGFYKVDDEGVWHRFWHQNDWSLIVRRSTNLFKN